jgi:hypothetical protein
MSTPREMADVMLDTIREDRGVSFVELKRMFGSEAHGDLVIQLRHNIVLWCDVSQTFFEAFQLIIPEVEMYPTSLLVYMVDGCILQLPIAKRLPKTGYKIPHWAPVTFSPKKSVQR